MKVTPKYLNPVVIFKTSVPQREDQSAKTMAKASELLDAMRDIPKFFIQ